MSWGKIKSSINSTLGTGEFRPLDKIITESFSSIMGGLQKGTIVPAVARSIDFNPKINEDKALKESGLYYIYVADNSIEYHFGFVWYQEGHYVYPQTIFAEYYGNSLYFLKLSITSDGMKLIQIPITNGVVVSNSVRDVTNGWTFYTAKIDFGVSE